MKVLVATGLYPPEIGGPATYAKMIEEELPPHGIEVATLPFAVVRKYPKVIRHVVYGWRLWRASKEADIIYALDPVSVGLPARVVAALRQKPFLIRLGGDYAWEQGSVRFGITDTLDEHWEKKHSWPLPVKLLSWLQSFVTKAATKVVVPSLYLKSIVKKWGVAPERIEVIYSALFPLVVTEKRETLREQLSFTTPTIVSAGRLVPWKGFPALINVIKALSEKYPDVTLVIVGDSGERAVLEAQVKKLELEAHVRLIGRLGKEALGATIKAADVFVLNTAYEGLSHQLLEVMDIGTPIVTTTAGGNVELIEDGVSGKLVAFNDEAALLSSIEWVLGHPGSRERMIQSARMKSKEFDKTLVTKKLVALLESVYACKQ